MEAGLSPARSRHCNRTFTIDLYIRKELPMSAALGFRPAMFSANFLMEKNQDGCMQ